MSGQTKIGYLVSQYPATSHTFIRREVEALCERGIDIATYSIRRPAEAELAKAADREAASGTQYILPLNVGSALAAHATAIATAPLRYFHVLRLALGHRAPGAKALLWSLFHFVESITLARILKRDGITRLHNHFANSGATVGFLTTRFLGLPWSLTLHGISETDYPAGLLLGEKIRAAEFVACVSWFGRAQAMRLTPPDQWRKFEIVRCGVDLNAMPPRPEAVSQPDDVFRIVCVGRLSAEKGQAGMLQALKGVRETGLDARVTFVGDGPERVQLEALGADLGLADSVTFLGRVPEQETLGVVASADLLAMSSFMEGLPVVLMEAMAMGIPVVAPRVAGIPELVTHGEHGLLFTPANWAELAAAIIEAANAPEQRVRMVQAASEKVTNEFEIGRAVAPLVAKFASS